MVAPGLVTRKRSRHIANTRATSSVFKPALLVLALATAFSGAHGQANPTGGVAIHGQANFVSPTANQLNVVTQNGAGTSHSAINWQSFSIAPGSSTNFQQPSATSTVINRVVTNTPSTLYGTLSSNGRLVLVNQAGIAVGAGAIVDTAGFAASALRMSDADALAGKLRFGDNLGSSSRISVDGRITARNGDVVLTAPNIDVGTTALIQSPNGSTVLAAGQQVEISGRGLEGISMLVRAPSDTARNLGTLRGDAVGIFAGTLRHSGEIQATTASLQGGSVVLKASEDAYVDGASRILATGTTGGRVDVLGNRVAVLGTSVIDASGTNGGGAIRIGGDYQGKNAAVQNAQISYVGPGTSLKADATATGDGGKVIVWADDITRAYGRISANAKGAGNGGFVETSGHRYLDIDGIQVSTTAQTGNNGMWLLDPADVTISHGLSLVPINMGSLNPFTPASLASASTLTDATINQNLATTNITVTTVNNLLSGAGNGDIIFDGATNGGIVIDKGASSISTVLNLNANRNIVFGSGTTTLQNSAGLTGPLSIFLNAGTSDPTGSISTAAGASVVLNGIAGEVSPTIKNGKTWHNSGTLTMNGLSVIRLPLESQYGTFSNEAGGVLNVNSASQWSFLTGGTANAGVFNNAGTVNVNGAFGGNSTSWEAAFTNFPGGALNIKAGKILSMQNGKTLDGSVFVDTGGQLLLSEQHPGPVQFTNTVFGGAGLVSVYPGITANFSNTSGAIGQMIANGTVNFNNTTTAIGQLSTNGTVSFNNASGAVGQLTVNGAVNVLSGNLGVTNYLQTSVASTFGGAGGVNISSGFSHTGGIFNPAGAVSINQASGDLIFGDTLIAASIALSASAGALKVNSPLTTAGAMTLNAATGLTVNARLIAGTTFDASTTGTPGTMKVNSGISSSGALNLSLSGGLILQSGAGFAAYLESGGNQSIGAKYLEVNAGGVDDAYIASSAGSQFITTSGKNAFNEGFVIQNAGTGRAFVSNVGPQTITVNDADIARITGTVGDAWLRTNGSQNILIRGTGQNSFQIGSATATGASEVDGVNQAITAGQSGQLGNIKVRGGVTDGKYSYIYNLGGAQTISTTGTLMVIGGAASGLSGTPSACINVGACASVINDIASAQNITAGNILVQAGSTGGYNIGAIQALNVGATQTINVTGGGSITLAGGSSTNVVPLRVAGMVHPLVVVVPAANNNNQASIYTQGTAQAINFLAGGALQITGGTGGVSNFAQIVDSGAASSQTITGATSISLVGGASGGGVDTGNGARLRSYGSQAVSVGTGGITLLGGSGIFTDNDASISQSSTTGTQNITVGGGGGITMVGGSSTATTVGAGHGSRALIEALGTSQQIQFTSGGALAMTGGTAGQRNFASIQAENGTQIIAGSPTILMTGGAAGGVSGEGNGAYINSVSGSQNITASSLTLLGGLAGTENLAQIRQGAVASGLSSSQAITVTGSGSSSLRGGSGTANLARIQSFGSSQALAFNGGNLLLQGGTGLSNNFARIHAVNGTQSITGSPNITVLGGATGGADTAGNFADIFSSLAAQTIVGRNITLVAGASGNENFAGIRAPIQDVTAHGNMTLTGGGSAPSSDGTSGGGTRVGGVTGSPTNLRLIVDGDLTLTGGSVAKGGSAIGSNVVGAQTTDITITAGGNVTLNPGSVPGTGSRIGSPTINVAGGDISITAAGTIALNGLTAADTAIRTLGNVSLNANLLSLNNLVSGGTINASGQSGVNLGGAGQLAAVGSSGDTIKVVTGSGNFSNLAGPTALSAAPGGRWLIFSNDPAKDTLGGLTSDFSQFNTTFASAAVFQNPGNGLVYRVAAQIPVAAGVTAAQAQSQAAFLDLLQKTLDAQADRPLTRDKRDRKDVIASEGDVCR